MSGKYGDLEVKCKKTTEHVRLEMKGFRTGRANTALLENVRVEYYGSRVPLIQMGMVSAPEPRLLTIQVYDGSATESVDKAIRSADLGLNPQREGNLIRIAIPALTEERRKEFIKKLHKLGEDNKIVIRNHRRDAIDDIKKQEKDKKISQDDARRHQDDVQKITDKFIAELDTLVAAKEKEMMEI